MKAATHTNISVSKISIYINIVHTHTHAAFLCLPSPPQWRFNHKLRHSITLITYASVVTPLSTSHKNKVPNIDIFTHTHQTLTKHSGFTQKACFKLASTTAGIFKCVTDSPFSVFHKYDRDPLWSPRHFRMYLNTQSIPNHSFVTSILQRAPTLSSLQGLHFYPLIEGKRSFCGP